VTSNVLIKIVISRDLNSTVRHGTNEGLLDARAMQFCACLMPGQMFTFDKASVAFCDVTFIPRPAHVLRGRSDGSSSLESVKLRSIDRVDAF
jgi:hypothetical protein